MIGTASLNDLRRFDNSAIRDRSLQLNLFGRARLSEGLRLAAFAGWGRAACDFRFDDAGLDVDGAMTGKRRLYGAALSGDIPIDGLVVTTDAIVSRAVEQLGAAKLDARYEQESASNWKLSLGRVDMTRISVPVHLPFSWARAGGLEPTRLALSPGVLCQDTDQDRSAMTCGYQLGVRFTHALSWHGRFRAEASHERVDGYATNLFSAGFERRFGVADALLVQLHLDRRQSALRAEDCIMLSLSANR